MTKLQIVDASLAELHAAYSAPVLESEHERAIKLLAAFNAAAPVPNDLLWAVQALIDSQEIWRSPVLASVACELIAAGRCTRARRSYSPNPKRAAGQ